MFPLLLTSLVALASCANAQYYNPYSSYRTRLPGGVIAGIILAVVIPVVLMILLITCLCFRRRQGYPLIPSRGVAVMHPYRQQHGFAGASRGDDYYQPSEGYHSPPPPPYHGNKEGYWQGQNGAASGGFAPAPGIPPTAHVNNARTTWPKENY